MIDWILANWQVVLVIISAVVSSASVALHAIAPLTKWTGDDKASTAVDWLLRQLHRLALTPKPSSPVALKPKE